MWNEETVLRAIHAAALQGRESAWPGNCDAIVERSGEMLRQMGAPPTRERGGVNAVREALCACPDIHPKVRALAEALLRAKGPDTA